MVGRAEVVAAYPHLAATWDDADAVFPVRITRSWWRRMQGEPALAAQVLPSPEELRPAEGDLLDPVGDAQCSPVPWVVHKYPDRVLLLTTKRCHLYCRYCFRRTHKPEERLDPTPQAWSAALAYVAESGASEVILSGGDPLVLRDEALFETIDAVRAVPSVRRVRIHTRAPITAPWRVTPELVEGLARRAPVYVVVHCNHPSEVDDDVRGALRALLDAGIAVLNQAVLLRGVNDAVDTLVALQERMGDLGVRPYYLHATDAVAGNAHLRVPLEDGLALVEAMSARLSGILRPRYVIDPPDGGGKVEVARWVQGGR